MILNQLARAFALGYFLNNFIYGSGAADLELKKYA